MAAGALLALLGFRGLGLVGALMLCSLPVLLAALAFARGVLRPKVEPYQSQEAVLDLGPRGRGTR